jgi:DNA-binding MarR family transcriptional regulator
LEWNGSSFTHSANMLMPFSIFHPKRIWSGATSFQNEGISQERTTNALQDWGTGMDRFGAISNAARLPSTVLVIADTERGAAAARHAIDIVGARLIGCLDTDAASARLEQQVSADAVMIEIDQDPGFMLDVMCRQIDQLVANRKTVKLIAAPLDQIDSLARHMSDQALTLMCEPSVADRALALGLALDHTDPVLTDGATELESARLRRLAEEVARIARTLSSLSATAPISPGYSTGVGDMVSSFRSEPAYDLIATDQPDAGDLRLMIRLRRLRDQFFDATLFADPAWDMLLDLMAARAERVQVAVSSLCIAAAVPPTTALRWIKSMTDAGLLERVADPDDGRRIFIQLSETAAAAMVRYLSAAKRLGGAAI